MSQVDFNFQRLYQTPCCSCHHIEQLNIFKSHFLSFDVKTKLQMFNTSYLTDLCIVSILKMESVTKNTIFGLKMIVKSGPEKIFLKFLHVGDYFSLLHKSFQNHKFSNKEHVKGTTPSLASRLAMTQGQPRSNC